MGDGSHYYCDGRSTIVVFLCLSFFCPDYSLCSSVRYKRIDSPIIPRTRTIGINPAQASRLIAQSEASFRPSQEGRISTLRLEPKLYKPNIKIYYSLNERYKRHPFL
ncbi:hypothetical protein ACS0TY_013890 [Phlomoides rotata]